jgi:hypothetical protein
MPVESWPGYDVVLLAPAEKMAVAAAKKMTIRNGLLKYVGWLLDDLSITF